MPTRHKEVSAPFEVIENQLLTALDDKSKVAILATQDDLDLLISALAYSSNKSNASRTKMLDGLKQLRNAAFKKQETRKCRVCGCTDDKACPGGCCWIEVDLCSQCRS